VTDKNDEKRLMLPVEYHRGGNYGIMYGLLAIAITYVLQLSKMAVLQPSFLYIT
jgi:hypothetical protein